jgi:hypothetical protein
MVKQKYICEQLTQQISEHERGLKHYKNKLRSLDKQQSKKHDPLNSYLLDP